MTTAPETAEKKPLLEVRDLSKLFPIKSGFWGRISGHVRAVDRVSFSIPKGQTYSLVGESGCGKTTIGRSILRLIPPTSGSVIFDGQEMNTQNKANMRELRRRMQIVFQDPYSSLNSRQTVGSIITEPMKIHKLADKNEQRNRLAELLETVGLSPEHALRYPHEFSGGQRQRICIARALSLKPDFIVCDEAVSALDVSIQAQILNLLQDLQQTHNIAYLFISHNLNVVRHISHTVGVMYLGQIMEEAPCDMIFDNPLHPYTKALLSAAPHIDPAQRNKRVILSGEVPSASNPPPGCPFHPRCPQAMPECAKGEIPTFEPETGHRVRCLLYKSCDCFCAK
jgi:oligopeptide/dipeptide ABC transporter ATP-binding protein